MISWYYKNVCHTQIRNNTENSVTKTFAVINIEPSFISFVHPAQMSAKDISRVLKM